MAKLNYGQRQASFVQL